MSHNSAKSPLLFNAIDSLQVGVDFYLDAARPTAQKHAILTIFHSIELLLKESLFRIHPNLIYKNLDKRIGADSYTVGINELFTRCENFGIKFTKDEEKIVRGLQKRRNEIEHHKYEHREADFKTIGQSVRFVHDFLPNHLELELRDLLDSDVYRKVREIILEYEELIQEVMEEVEARTTPVSKDDLISMKDPIECPDCTHITLVIDEEEEGYCHFCNTEFDVGQCPRCGQYTSSNLNEVGMCAECWDTLLERND